MNLEINKNLFAAWCGMIVSGYDLFNDDDLEILFLCNEIKDSLYNDSIARHFAFTKTNTVECNPYYPRASNLLVYCFYIDKQIDDYYSFLDYCGDTEYRNIEFQKWMEMSKCYIKSIITNDKFSKLFNNYVDIINRRFNGIDDKIYSVKHKLDEYNLITDIDIMFTPNLLQSKYLADYALVDNKIYIIATDFRERTIIHEYLHIVAKEQEKKFIEFTKENRINNFVDVIEMQRFGYLKDFSLDSQVHALEEQFVRHYTDLLTK